MTTSGLKISVNFRLKPSSAITAPLVKASNRSTQYVDDSKDAETRCEIGFDTRNGQPVQVRWSWKIKGNLRLFIPKSMDFSQSLLWFQAGGDFLKVSGIR